MSHLYFFALRSPGRQSSLPIEQFGALGDAVLAASGQQNLVGFLTAGVLGLLATQAPLGLGAFTSSLTAAG